MMPYAVKEGAVMAYYVCNGARLKCSMGSAASNLSVLHPVKPARVEGHPIAAMLDNKSLLNIKPFGQCRSLANPIVAAATAANYGRLQPMPCIPNTTLPWIGAKMSVRIKGNPALLDTSKLTCMWAGMIEITNPGQKTMKEGCTPLNYYAGLIQSEEKAKDVKVSVGNAVEPGEKVKTLTVKDFAEILERIERKKGYESARHYAAYHVDYWKLTKLARRYVDETDEAKKEEEKDNDPTLMPSRFMLLYGADDGKLRGQGNIDEHHDNFEGLPEHEISIANLRKALILLGHEVEETGPFDEPLFWALLQYLRRFGRVELERLCEDKTDEEKPMDDVSDKYGVATWRSFYKEEECGVGDGSVNHEKIINKLDGDYGDELVREKGGVPYDYNSSICYHYPWVPFSMTVNVEDDYQEKDDATYEIYDRECWALLGEGSFHKPYKIECLLPDSKDILVYADGSEVRLNPEPPSEVRLSEGFGEEEDTEPRIVKVYWSYWNGEKYIKVDEVSRHYADLYLIIETKNYVDGDTVNVVLEIDDGDQNSEINLGGTVYDDKAIIENAFEKKMNL
jgi:hypothetical protein